MSDKPANFLAIAFAEWRRRRVARARERAYFKAALAFNRIHTYQGDGRWMCPTCHKVHKKVVDADPLYIFLTGRQYPACCNFPEGHRLDFVFPGYATDTNWKLP